MEQKGKPAKAKDEKEEAKEAAKEAFEKSQSRFAGAPREKGEEEGTDLGRHRPEATMRAGREKPEQATAEAPAPVAAEPAPATSPYLAEHTVVSGDNLSYISKQYYGTADKYMKIYEANKEVIGGNPSLIRAGMVLKIPRLE
jgi:nucleoid-associated protein YgaU